MKSIENLRIRKVKVEVKGKMIEYDEYFLVDNNGEEIFNRDIEIENDERLYDIYKKQSNLLTNIEIKKIRQKYNLTQKDYALVIGVGEITVHRFEKGAIQTEAVDSIMRLSDDPDNMSFLLLQNKGNITTDLYEKLIARISELKTLKRHAIANIENIDTKKLEFRETFAESVAKSIVFHYNTKVDEMAADYDITPEYITPLKLQKLLYYVQGISLCIFGKKAFSEKIKAWSYGPVVEEIYHKYKANHNKELEIIDYNENISQGLLKIIEEVIFSYGRIEANNLIDFTHEEDPWKNTRRNCEITLDKIKEYFSKVYNIN